MGEVMKFLVFNVYLFGWGMEELVVVIMVFGDFGF